MSDDTTTWLKKNPSINPLRRSLKTSLRFHVPSSDMNTSIMSNPDKARDQGLFIPRMLQRTNVQMRKSRAFEFKVPELMPSKPILKKETGTGVKVKKIPTPNRVRKSFLPIPKTKQASCEKKPTKTTQPKPSSISGGAAGRLARRELIKKVVELSEIKKKEAESQVKVISGDSSVIRSILKKRASLRRTSQLLKKPKAKKVLFDGFENSDGEKENDADFSPKNQDDFNLALDEPTVFLNFPNGGNVDESPFEPVKEPLNWTVEETKPQQDVSHVIKLWESYKDGLENIQTARNSVEESFESLLRQSQTFQQEYQTYRETAEEMYCRLAKLGEEIDESLKKLTGGDEPPLVGSTPKSKRGNSSRKGTEKCDKIKMSDKSKAIKKITAGRKSVPLLKKEFLEESFCLMSRTGFVHE